jgi:hypothetical protein
VATDRGVNEGAGVLIAVPALAVALAIVSLPFIGGYLLLRRLGSGSDEEGTAAADGVLDDEGSGDTEEQEAEDSDVDERSEPETAAG